MSALHVALLAIQKDAVSIPKDKTNPHYKSRYASLDGLLDQVRPTLNTHGVVLSQWPTHVDGHPALVTRLTHAESGESVEATMLLLAPKMDPQGQGSALTYARRYALMAALGVAADEDDDGSRASRRETPAIPAEPVVEYASKAQNAAIAAEQDMMISLLGMEAARVAYEQELARVGVAPGSAATVAQADALIARLRTHTAVPA